MSCSHAQGSRWRSRGQRRDRDFSESTMSPLLPARRETSVTLRTQLTGTEEQMMSGFSNTEVLWLADTVLKIPCGLFMLWTVFFFFYLDGPQNRFLFRSNNRLITSQYQCNTGRRNEEEKARLRTTCSRLLSVFCDRCGRQVHCVMFFQSAVAHLDHKPNQSIDWDVVTFSCNSLLGKTTKICETKSFSNTMWYLLTRSLFELPQNDCRSRALSHETERGFIL